MLAPGPRPTAELGFSDIQYLSFFHSAHALHVPLSGVTAQTVTIDIIAGLHHLSASTADI